MKFKVMRRNNYGRFKIRLNKRIYYKNCKAYKEKYVLVKMIPEQKTKQIIARIKYPQQASIETYIVFTFDKNYETLIVNEELPRIAKVIDLLKSKILVTKTKKILYINVNIEE